MRSVELERHKMMSCVKIEKCLSLQMLRWDLLSTLTNIISVIQVAKIPTTSSQIETLHPDFIEKSDIQGS